MGLFKFLGIFNGCGSCRRKQNKINAMAETISNLENENDSLSYEKEDLDVKLRKAAVVESGEAISRFFVGLEHGYCKSCRVIYEFREGASHKHCPHCQGRNGKRLYRLK